MAGTEQTNYDTDLNLIIDIGNIRFTHADLMNFEYKNTLNKRITGSMKFIDRNADFVKVQSGEYGKIFFTNSTDESVEKFSAVDIMIDEILQEDVVAGSPVYNVTWSAGYREQLKKRTRAFAGTSVDALIEAIDRTGANTASYPSEATKPTDSMIWRHVRENMWEQLETIVSKSYLKNDYVFWVWDDVNNKFKISSLGNEKSYEDTYILTQSSDAVGSTNVVKAFIENPRFVVWQYDKFKKMNDIGINREKLFPNIAFSGIEETELLSANTSKTTFFDLIRDMGDDKQEDIMATTGMDSPEDVFGDLIVKRHWPNNTHAMYSLSDIYREYKISTYVKIIFVQIYNNVGPPMGSNVTVIKVGDDYKIRGITLDEDFSDAYIVQERQIEYTPVRDLSTEGPKALSVPFVTTLKLISDNFADKGTEHIKHIFKQITGSKSTT